MPSFIVCLYFYLGWQKSPWIIDAQNILSDTIDSEDVIVSNELVEFTDLGIIHKPRGQLRWRGLAK